MHNAKVVGTISALTATLVWSSSFIVLKVALEHVHSMSVIFLRMLIASLIFLVFYKKFINLHFTKEDIKYLSIMIFAEPCLYFIFETNALQYTSAGQAGVIASTMPLMAAFAAIIFLKEKVSNKLLFGSFIAMSGAIWLSVSADKQSFAPNPLLGNFLELLAMSCGAIYTIALKHLSKRFSALFLTAVQAFGGVIFFAPFASYEWMVYGFEFHLTSMLCIVYLGAIVTLGGYGLYNYALTLLPVSRVANFINLMPAFTVILAFFLLDERLNFNQILATGVIFLGVFISQDTKFRDKK